MCSECDESRRKSTATDGRSMDESRRTLEESAPEKIDKSRSFVSGDADDEQDNEDAHVRQEREPSLCEDIGELTAVQTALSARSQKPRAAA